MRWPLGPFMLIVTGVALLAFPQHLEGPPLVHVGVGHAITAIDALGVLPLVAGSVWLHAGIWNRRGYVGHWIRSSPGRAIAAFSAAGFGLGLLIASSMSFFFWWWAVGAALFLAMHVPVLMAARGRERSTVDGQRSTVD